MSEFLKIKNRCIGDGFKPLIIIELGINHNGNLNLAKKIINEAKNSGAEIIKHQTHIPEDEMSLEAKKIVPGNANMNIYDLIKKCAISENDELKLKKFVEKKNMIFISTPFSKKAVDRLVKFKVPAFKIGSGECNNYPLVEYICSFKKPIILSTGMNSIRTIKKSVKIIESNRIDYALMHTTNLYPTPYNLVRLNALDELRDYFPKAILGLSDHTPDNITSIAAIAKGAKIIEKHFVDTKKRKGPDISASIDKKQLKDLIISSKKLFLSIPGKKELLKEEKKTSRFAFASVVSIKNISKGEIFTEKNIWVKRPGNGYFLAEQYYNLLGKKSVSFIKKNTQIKKRHVKK
jgi:sialic acid synthase SpsE